MSDEIQEGLTKDPMFFTFVRQVVRGIETNNLLVISITCTKGRHRSVAIAELLRKWFYPDAIVQHLTIS